MFSVCKFVYIIAQEIGKTRRIDFYQNLCIIEERGERMTHREIFKKLPAALLPWYRENRRELPWREDKESYHIWLSEIMLQQTRVEAVKGYYRRFLQALPTVEALANAPEEQLHKLWEGLGYYSRVRNLKKAAQVVMEQHNGCFPRTYEDVIALPGIGEYTAGAILSIAFDQPIPAVDGNVLRVVARLTDDPTPVDIPAYKRDVKNALIYPREAGDFTQALMELGATVCGPNRTPDCENCPCKDFCLGHQNGTAESLPVALPKRGRREEERTVFVLSCDGAYALEKRPNKGLLAGLWQFPNTEGNLSLEETVKFAEEKGLPVREVFRTADRKHIFTHIQWNIQGIYMEVAERGGGYRWLTLEEIREEAALPTAFRQFMEGI